MPQPRLALAFTLLVAAGVVGGAVLAGRDDDRVSGEAIPWETGTGPVIALSADDSGAAGENRDEVAGGTVAAQSAPAATKRTAEVAPQAATKAKPQAVAGQVQGVAGSQRVRSAAKVPPATQRLNDYRTFIRLRVDDTRDLSAATNRALTLTRRYGGYVENVRYGTRTRDDGTASMTLRIPIRRVQEAIVALSQLGTILEQRVSIKDVENQVRNLDRREAALRRQIAELRAALENPNLDEGTKARLQYELSEARRQLAAREREEAAAVQRARFSTVRLELTTRDAPAAKPDEEGRIEGAARDAIDALGAVGAVTIYALIVTSPFLLLLLLALLGRRTFRRRADDRLLARP